MLIVTALKVFREIFADAMELRRTLSVRYPHLRMD